MADFQLIKQEIDSNVNTNGVGAITGAILNTTLKDIVDAVNAAKEDEIPAGIYHNLAWFNSYGKIEDSGFNPNSFSKVFVVSDIENIPFDTIANVEAGDVVCVVNGMYVPHTSYVVATKDVLGGEVMLLKIDTATITAVFYTNNSYSHTETFTFSDKADKVSGATSGDFAGLDADGNLTDSGSKASDFATAAQGAKADSAYQKPASGIPSSDMTNAVQTSLGKADTAYQKPATGIPSSDMSTAVQTSLGLADTAIQDVSGKMDKVPSATVSNIAQFASGGGVVDSGVNVFDLAVLAEDASTPPASMEPNTVYKYGTLAGNTTFPALATPTNTDIANVYCWTFATPATAPTITWPVAITDWAGGSAPTINASKKYEVSVMDGVATIIEA